MENKRLSGSTHGNKPIRNSSHGTRAHTAPEPFRVKQRDRQSIELKFRYMLSRELRRNRQTSDVSIYFFLPYSFNVGPDNYDRSSFYDDLKLYLRFNTPTLTAQELLSRESRISPLVRVERMIRAARREGKSIDSRNCVYEGKLLGCIYKSLLRDVFGSAAAVSPLGRETSVSGVRESFKEIRDIARRFHRATSAIEQRVNDADPDLVQHMRMIDEHLSLLIEKYAATLFQRLRGGASRELRHQLSRIIAKEIGYRENAGYPTVIRGRPDEAKLEEHIYREKILKRYASEVLFFDVRRRNTGKGMEQVLYAVAAGIAMIFATGMAFLGQSTYGRLTTSLFIVLVVSYMLKDRMKDFFRDAFRKRLGSHFFDRSARLYDSRHRRKLAIVRERTSFIAETRIDPVVRELRNRGTFERALARTTAESVFRYHKRIVLFTRTMKGIHRRISGVADISIIDLGGFLRGLASQRGLIPSLDDKGSIELNPVKRIYHLNMIVQMKTGDSERQYRYRMIMDAGGIVRIEPVEGVDPIGGEPVDS